MHLQQAVLFSILLGLVGVAEAETPPDDHYLARLDTRSPDRRYLIKVPMVENDGEDMVLYGEDQLVDLRGNKVVAELGGDGAAFDVDLNHRGTGDARWTTDSSALLWIVTGRWCADAMEVVKLGKSGVAWKLDLLHVGQQAILEKTRKAAPAKYAAKKIEDDGSPTAYPDGFTVDVRVAGEPGTAIVLPMKVTVVLSSDPKGGEEDALESTLEGVVAKDGKFIVKSFRLGRESKPDDPW